MLTLISAKEARQQIMEFQTEEGQKIIQLINEKILAVCEEECEVPSDIKVTELLKKALKEKGYDVQRRKGLGLQESAIFIVMES